MIVGNMHKYILLNIITSGDNFGDLIKIFRSGRKIMTKGHKMPNQLKCIYKSLIKKTNLLVFTKNSCLKPLISNEQGIF